MEGLHLIVLILHVLGAGLLLGIVFLSVFLACKSNWSAEKIGHLKYIGKFGKWGSAWQLLTGLYLAWNEWDELGSNKLFWAKLAIYVVEGVLAGMLIEKKMASLETGKTPKWLSPVLTVHAILIIAITVLGVLIVEA